ncbi:PorT family protein [Aquimarina sp. BL5]|uniref:porin family protein n=1 Tax=Aquimarina sp. BL5 TaxID=1714860 RepID=UPI000E485109|nr:porin family protein [Aquimarina sp. BL5]AXT49540.1 PorT family protein [Aquimarina sp. BL5]RKM93428.1 PorT family protein [Aquimarina sp. BL5]
MKRNTFILMMILSFVSVNAQKLDDEDPLYARAGFKGGINYSNILGDADGTEGRIRIHLGAVVEYPISSKFFIQGELLYSAQGYKVDVGGQEQKISVNYFSLPIITKTYITERISLETGPQFALVTNVGNDDVADNDPFFDSFNSFDVSWAFGAGYKLESGLFFQLRYNLGLTNINDTSIMDVTNRNSVAQLSIGYLFKTKNNRRIIREQ